MQSNARIQVCIQAYCTTSAVFLLQHAIFFCSVALIIFLVFSSSTIFRLETINTYNIILVMCFFFFYFRLGSNSTVRELSPSSIHNSQSYDSLSNDNSTYSSIDAISNSSMNAVVTITNNNKRIHDLAMCAVLLDEWLKELAAISQEQSIVLLTDTFINHF